MQRPGQFLKIFGATIGVLCVMAVLFNVAVDPYYIFGMKLVAGWNRVKPAAYDRAAAAKTYLLERAHPRTLLLGNSRIEVGFNPQSPEWPADMRPVFNAGLGGRDLSISAKLLEDALANPGLRHVLVGVDVLDFLVPDGRSMPPGPVDAGPDQDRMRVAADLSPNSDEFLARTKDAFEATLTLGAVTASVTTVLAQHQSAPTTMTPLGFNPLDEYRSYVALHGFRDLFDQKQAQYVARFSDYARPDFAQPYRTRSFRSLRELITTAVAHDLDVTLIIYPYHAWVMDLLHRDDLWSSFEAWKRALVRVVAELDPSHRVRLVDFSGYNSYTTAQIPALGDLRTQVPWYWEPGHFRAELGDRIIARLYDHQDDFGRDLTPVTVDRVIASIQHEATLVAASAGN